MKSEPGTYVLVLQGDTQAQVTIGKWGQLRLDHGYYLYVGSALGPGGLRARVSRHCRKEKPKRWHVDFLRARIRLVGVWYVRRSRRLEHAWAKALEGVEQTTPIRGFGCSDCRCLSHLFYVADEIGVAACANALPHEDLDWTCGDADVVPR